MRWADVRVGVDEPEVHDAAGLVTDGRGDDDAVDHRVHGGPQPRLRDRQRSLGLLLLGHVVHDSQPAGDVAVGLSERAEGDLEAADRPVGVAVVGIPEPGLPGGHRAGRVGHGLLVEADGHHLGRTPADHLGRFQSHAGGVDRVGVDDPQVGIGDDDAVGRLLARGRQAVALAARLGVGQGSMDGRNEGSQATLRDVRPGAVAQCLDD